MDMENPVAENPENKISFSLAGCGFLGIYHIGAAACLSEHVPHVLENARFCGASAGTLIACSLICRVPMDQCVDFTLRLARSSGQYPLGGWEPSVNIEAILRSSIEQVLPADAHLQCTDRLFISVTSLSGMKNQIISKFKSRKHLIDTLMCSAYVPGFSSYTIPRMDNELFIDGGLSDNLPILDSNTITICPWAGEHSICPQDPEGQSFPLTMMNMSICPSTCNLARFKDAFFCPKPEILKNYCWQGYDDALRFLHENHLIHCQVHRVLAVLTNLEHRMSVDCDDCEHHRDHARSSHLPPTILVMWDNIDWWRVIPRCTGLLIEPFKKWFKIWLIPVNMLRHQVVQLFMLAYFQMDKVRNGGLSAEVLKLVKKLCQPRQFLWEMFMVTVTKLILQTMEYWTSVLSEVFALRDTVKFAQQIIRDTICGRCGLPFHHLPGPLLNSRLLDRNKGEDAGSALQEVPEEEGGGQEKGEDVPEIVVQEDSKALAQAGPEGAEGGGESAPEAAETMAVWVDIHADSVDIALPLPEEAQALETVHVEGVGEIKEVVIDPVVRLPASKADQAEGGQKAADVSPPNTERIHQYVHKWEQLKSIMTLHYVDENSQRHTESLFVEDMTSQGTGEETPSLGSHPSSVAGSQECVEEAGSKDGGETDRRSEEAEEAGSKDGWETDGRSEEAEEQVDREVKQLLENKLFTGQRQFEQSYEASHQRRLKKRKMREVRKDTGHFSLQLISMRTDPPPSPVLSRTSSLLNVAVEEEGELVRSVSDACTLASSLRRLREMRRMGAESSLCASCNSLNEAPLPASQGGGMEPPSPCPLHSGLSASADVPGLPSLPRTLRTPLRKSQSDTSEVAANLRRLKTARSSIRESRIPARESPPEEGDLPPSAGRRPLPRVATAPLLASTPPESALSSDRHGATAGPSSCVSQHSLLPIIPDDMSSSHTQQAVPDMPGHRERHGDTRGEVCQQAPSTVQRLTSGGSVQQGEVMTPRRGVRLERSSAINRSGRQRSQLLSSLRELEAQSSTADSAPTASTHPTLPSPPHATTPSFSTHTAPSTSITTSDTISTSATTDATDATHSSSGR